MSSVVDTEHTLLLVSPDDHTHSTTALDHGTFPRSNDTDSAPTGQHPEDQQSDPWSEISPAGCGSEEDCGTHVELGAVPLACLFAQHTSNIFGASTANYAAYIFLAEMFSDTLAPASTMGMIGALAPMFLAGRMGKLIDTTNRLSFARNCVVAQKLAELIIYGCFIVYLGPFKQAARSALHGIGTWIDVLVTWSLFVAVLLFMVVIKVTDVGLTVASEKDWVLTISQGDSMALTKLNSYLRMIATTSRIFPPVVTAMFVVAFGHRGAAVALVVTTTAALVLEYWWLQVVFNRFPALLDNRMKHEAAALQADQARIGALARHRGPRQGPFRRLQSFLSRESSIWRRFASLPIFPSSIAVTVLWVSTLTLDGTGVAYFKLVREWDEVVLAKIRMGALLTSLMGSYLVTLVEPRIGIAPTALTSDVLALLCLSVSLVGFFTASKIPYEVSGMVMIVPIVLSRAFFTSFELAQLKELQLALAERLDRNELSALQSALQNIFALMRYLMLFVVSDPTKFKWTAAVSVGASLVSVSTYIWHMINVSVSRHSKTIQGVQEDTEESRRLLDEAG